MNELLDIYTRYGVILTDGDNTILIPMKYTTRILLSMKTVNSVILGGDLYRKLPDGEFEHTYENWHYDGVSSSESIEKADKYLSKIHNENLYVSFVFS